jgi:hypothetical protein
MSVITEVEGVLEAIGRDFEKGLVFAVKYLPLVDTLAAELFPPAVAPLEAVTAAANLLQNAVVLVEQKYAAAGVQNGTGAQKAAEVLTLTQAAVTSLLAEPAIAADLKSAGVTVDSTYISNLIAAVVAILNVQPIPANLS